MGCDVQWYTSSKEKLYLIVVLWGNCAQNLGAHTHYQWSWLRLTGFSLKLRKHLGVDGRTLVKWNHGLSPFKYLTHY